MDRRFSHCAITFDGHLLDYEIDSFMTVNVEGRQLLPQNLETVTVPGRNGDVVLGGTYPPRNIVVHFLLGDYKNTFFLEKIKSLNEILYTNKDVEFSFRDEEGYRIGRLSSIEDPPYDSNIGIGKFIIHCSDPFLYGILLTTKDKIENLRYKKYPVKIEKIEVVTNQTEKLVITNKDTGKKIILNHTFSQGNKVVLNKEKIELNGKNIMHSLDFVNSDYQEFELFSGNEVVITGGTATIYYREKIL